MSDSQTAAPAPERVGRARIAVSIAFFLFGLGFGLWFVHIPIVVSRLAVEPATLGLALLLTGLGAVISQPLAGIAVARIGSRRATIYTLPLMAVVNLVPITAANIPMLFVGAALMGIVGGLYNVGLNTQASEIERARGRPSMSQFHGFFSVGGLASATLGGLMIGAGYGNGSGALAVAIVLLVSGTWALTGFIDFPPPPRPAKGEPKFVLPAGALFGIAVLAFFCNGIEGSVNDWSTLFLHTVKGMSEASAAWGYALFALAMASMRFAGGAIVERLGEKRLITIGGFFVAIGMAIAVLAPPLISPVGFLIVGFGAANAIPILVSSGAKVPGVAPSIGVAAVSTAALVGFLLGPPGIGFLAQAFGLGTALGIVGATGLLVAVLAYLRQWTPAPQPA